MQSDISFLSTVVPETQVVQGSLPSQITFSVDSRTTAPGEIFVAVAGAAQDGHSFLADALSKGAAGVLIAADKVASFYGLPVAQRAGVCCITVNNPLQALLAYARAWRLQFTIPIVGVTGSVGKTSTKERIGLIARCAGKNFYVSMGNQNTLIGIALNILRMEHTHDGAVFELGIAKRGEMQQLVDLLRPTTAVITQVGHGHMAGIGGLSDIGAEKRAICTYFSASNVAIVNGDQQQLGAISYPHPVIKFGSKMTNQVQARKIEYSDEGITFIFKIYRRRYTIALPGIFHAGAVYNMIAAAAVAQLLDISDAHIVEGMKASLVVKKRFEPVVLQGSASMFIDDSYNANPESTKAALLAFHHMPSSLPKIAVLGDMLELGINSAFWHRQIGRFLRKAPSITRVIAVGEHMRWIQKTAPITVDIVLVNSWKEAAVIVDEIVRTQDVFILLKGSRSMNIGNVLMTLHNKQKELHG